MKQNKRRGWMFIIVILIILGLFSWLIAGFISLFVGEDTTMLSGNVALIPVKGLIVTEKGSDLFGQKITSSGEIVNFIEKAGENKNIKGVIFEIDSPGGSPVASEEIANAIKKVNKTTVAWIRETGASGAYWIASATDYIIASRMSVTGSIGVFASYLEFAGLIERYNMTYQRLVSGEYKDLGDPFKSLTSKERIVLQEKIDMLHDYFIEEVAKNRNMKKEDVKKLATGVFYLGSEAKELGLIDMIGGKYEVEEFLKKKLNTTTIDIVEYKKEATLWDVLANVLNQNSFYVGEGIGNAFFDERASNKIDIIT